MIHRLKAKWLRTFNYIHSYSCGLNFLNNVIAFNQIFTNVCFINFKKFYQIFTQCKFKYGIRFVYFLFKKWYLDIKVFFLRFVLNVNFIYEHQIKIKYCIYSSKETLNTRFFIYTIPMNFILIL